MKFILMFFSLLFIFCNTPVFSETPSGNSYTSCFEKAQECRNMNELQDALRHFKEAMKYKADDTEALFAIGQVYDQLGDNYQAEEYYKKVLARSADPKKVYDIGAYYFKTNQVYEVEEIYTKAWRHRGNIFETNMGMGDYNFLVKDYDKAIEFYEIAIRKQHGQGNDMKSILYFRYAMALNIIGKKQKALDACRMAARFKDSEDIRELHRQLSMQ